MLNIIWLGMMVVAVVVGLFTGKTSAIVLSVTESAKFAFSLGLSLTGIMTLWLGLMKIAEASGLVQRFTQLAKPLLHRLFPDVPPEHPAMGAMTMNLVANILGLANAATPFGLKAMAELEKLNPTPGIATNTMCTFIALHCSNLQIIPITAISLLAVNNASHPTDIIIPCLLTSFIGVITAIVASNLLAKLPRYRYRSVLLEESA